MTRSPVFAILSHAVVIVLYRDEDGYPVIRERQRGSNNNRVKVEMKWQIPAQRAKGVRATRGAISFAFCAKT